MSNITITLTEDQIIAVKNGIKKSFIDYGTEEPANSYNAFLRRLLTKIDNQS